jgi:hypothetical protein
MDEKSVIVGGGSALSSVVMRGFGAPKSARKLVSTPGSPVQLASSATQCRRVDVTALNTNKGFIFLGDSSVSGVAGSEQGTLIIPTGTISLQVSDVSSLWIDVQTGNANDGVTIVYYN